MKQLLQSLEDYFSCSITLSDEAPDGASGLERENSEGGDILPIFLEDSTRVTIPAGRLHRICTVHWDFPGKRSFTLGELEHLLQWSRMLARMKADRRREEELSFYRQALQHLGKKAAEGVVLFDREGKTLYQNSIARNKHITERYRAYIQEFEDNRMGDTREHSVFLEGTLPVRLDISGLYSGDSFIGRIITAYSGTEDQAVEDSERPHKGYEFFHILGKAPILRKTLRIAERAAGTDTTVLLSGESGTGKEQFARAIHYLSHRRNKPFVAINCAAIPEHLLESELFGYEEGAFTGATRGGKIGKIEAADSGTIFLDEIGDMPLNLQAKLLRVLQRREFERVGSTRPISVNVRFISATHRDLQQLMKDRSFRSDLFYRLNVVPIHIPALREHREDVSILLNYYLKKYALARESDFSYFNYDAMRFLVSYDWPGNIRELENVVQYCLTMSKCGMINTEDLPPGILPEKPVPGSPSNEETGEKGGHPGTPHPETLLFETYRAGNPEEKNNQEDLDYMLQSLKGKRRAKRQDILRLIDVFGDDTKGKRSVADHLDISLATLYRRIGKEKG